MSKDDRFEIAFFQGIMQPPAIAIVMYRDANEKLSPGIILLVYRQSSLYTVCPLYAVEAAWSRG